MKITIIIEDGKVTTTAEATEPIEDSSTEASPNLVDAGPAPESAPTDGGDDSSFPELAPDPSVPAVTAVDRDGEDAGAAPSTPFGDDTVVDEETGEEAS